MSKIKKQFKIVSLIAIIISFGLTRCESTENISTTFGNQSITDEAEEQNDSLTYIADFFDNSGERWLSVEGKTFSINIIKMLGL